MRGQLLGRIRDYERADDVAREAATAHPKSADAHHARALVHGALHRFDAAADELDVAERLGTPREHLAASRASLLVARGRYDEAAAIACSDGTIAAVIAARRQRLEEAEQLFDHARRSLRDVAPFPLAWMDVQRASVLEAAGQETRARAWYAEAIDVVPVHPHAAVHLAATEPPDRAIARLEPLVKTSDDPEVLAALGAAHRRAGHDAEARRLVEAARARYDELLLRHPEAFSDHAARFYLREGDVGRALVLAEENARTRNTEEAIDLWSAAAAAADAGDRLCASASAMQALPYASADRRRLAGATLARCQAPP